MLEYGPLSHLPTAEELPETDHQPVDNESQIWVPNLLATLLTRLWKDRSDWFWGINLGIYYDPELLEQLELSNLDNITNE
ncbi:MAG: hypothetical protein F6K47_25960 [Symploca sp. SIO2E6]|nr:hypothetical protein [Symploca sp. SIO2E6]